MGKRSRRRRRGDELAAPATDYAAPGGDAVLTLRGAMSPATRRAYAELAPKVREDLWQRRVEFLFERLVVAWTVSGVPTTRQKELLQRFRVATRDERAWIRDVLREHLAEHFPDLEAP